MERRDREAGAGTLAVRSPSELGKVSAAGMEAGGVAQGDGVEGAEPGVVPRPGWRATGERGRLSETW
jgi:hypothetical protein